ncbi:MAG: helix-turn-helix domain-containing protein [Pyrinomonadaceae bacterium]|nr:helix-turn-helix domain-containing protein [Pyrinomonadaceae bacterium]
MSEKELKASEVAKIYDVNPYTVKGWIRAGMFPGARLEESVAGSVWLIPESDLDGFVKPEKGRPKKAAK